MEKTKKETTLKIKKPVKAKKTPVKLPKPEKKVKEVTPKKVYTAVGRRKTAIARSRLVYEKGDILVNNKPIDIYFSDKISKIAYSEPFRTTNTLGHWSGTVFVSGGGTAAQLDALIHSFSRLLVVYNESFRSILRKKGFMTRDPRAKERKKPGLMGARKQKQSPKR